MSNSLNSAIAIFGASTKAKLSNKAATGAPEDQLRAPMEALFRDLAALLGLPDGVVSLVGESTLSHLKTRPDYAVTVRNALVGYIEVKAPGKGANPQRFSDEHDKKQWGKLKSLPNLLYTDGNNFTLWQNGTLQGAVSLAGDVETSGDKLSAPPTLLPLISSFLTWNPISPRTAKQLAETAARLCRLLRDEVTEELERGNPGLTLLATEWRSLLFPNASNAEFADGYAQAVTFGLLVARARGIELKDGIGKAALELRTSNSLIATALRLLTDDPLIQSALKTSTDTLTRVLDVVDWPTLTKGNPDAWLYFYEDFLEVYDNALRKRTGSYYTPPEVVAAMVRLVDEALRDPALFGRPLGLASRDVTVADPAVGTGAYLLGALRRIAETVEADLGPGAVPGAIAAAAERLIGFEMQFGSFAVAQLRLLAEMQTLMSISAGDGRNLPTLRLFVTDTLGDPYATQTQFSGMVAPIGESRRQANEIKRGEPITVVIGNPPYKEKAKGRGGWIEDGSPGRAAPMDLWSPPKQWGLSAHTHNLKNLYIYFWRWATWKIFGSDHFETTGEMQPKRPGVICFITMSSFLTGRAFQKMRADLRRDCSHIWVIDCSPDGTQPEVPTRIFQGVQQAVCIVLALRAGEKDERQPGQIWFRDLPEGARENKFATLSKLTLDSGGWIAGPSGWRDPFRPAATGIWGMSTPIAELFNYSVSGVTPHRTWIISPDSGSLGERWRRLQSEPEASRRAELFHPDRDRDIDKKVSVGLGEFGVRSISVSKDVAEVITPIRYAYRSFDRHWIVPDHRLISMARPELWRIRSAAQVFLTSLESTSPVNGPAISFSELIADLNHYKGSEGGRVFPLWRDAATTVPNIKSELLTHLSVSYGTTIGPEDVLTYLAGVMAHPAFTARFQSDFVQSGLRLPLTIDAALFAEAAAIGREVVWLHCYGERFADAGAGRPAGPPRMAKGTGPSIPKDGMIPGAPEPLPDTMDYEPARKRLRIGKGHIDNVPQGVWDYEVSGKNVLRQWFSYRRRDRTRPIIGDRRPPSPLDKIQPDHWLDDYTTDLMNLLHVLGRLVALEPAQADLLERICAAPLLASPFAVAADET